MWLSGAGRVRPGPASASYIRVTSWAIQREDSMSYHWITRLAAVVVAALVLAFLFVGRLGIANAAPARATMNVDAYDNFFQPKSVTVAAGTTVRWKNEGER